TGRDRDRDAEAVPRGLSGGLHPQGDGSTGRRRGEDRREEAAHPRTPVEELVSESDAHPPYSAVLSQQGANAGGLSLPRDLRVLPADDLSRIGERPARRVLR